MRGKYTWIFVVLLALGSGVLAFGVGRLSAAPGTLDSPAPPDSTYSYTLEDIYNRLDSGAAGARSTFTEPSSGPGTETIHTLKQIMDEAPAVDDTNGVTQTHVLAGKTFWGLTSGQWGPQTGAMPDNGAVTIVPTTISQTIAAGYHDGLGYVVGDTALVGWNIRSGVTIFGVSGTCYRLPATGQTASYGAGDDGAYHLGCMPLVGPCAGDDGCNFNRTDLPWTSSSGTGFTDNGDGTVTDNLTGLVWLKDANCAVFFDGDATGSNNRNWSSALTAANSLASGYCELSDGSSAGDWRLPNINELCSPIDPAQDWPALPAGHPFTGIQSWAYWSSTTEQPGTTLQAWYVILVGGYVSSAGKSSEGYVWPVRGGQ